MVGCAVVDVLENARKLKYLKVISLVVFLRFFYTLLWKPLNSGFEPKRGKFMVYARKALIHAGLLDTMVSQSYLDNLIETCPQITRNQVVQQWARGFESHRFRQMNRVRSIEQFYWTVQYFVPFSMPESLCLSVFTHLI